MTTRELREVLYQLAKESGRSPVEIITDLQRAAAEIGDEELLSKLCKLKWDYAAGNIL